MNTNTTTREQGEDRQFEAAMIGGTFSAAMMNSLYESEDKFGSTIYVYPVSGDYRLTRGARE